jgi:hypothetical protein
MTGTGLKLPRGADELLREFPLKEPDFEAQAQAIEARLQAPLAAPLGDLLAVPDLSAEPGEPVRAAASATGSLTELARRSLHQPTDDSTALVKELLAVTSQARRPDAEMVARVRAAGKTGGATPLPSGATPLPLGERPSGVVARVGVAAAAPPPEPRPAKRGLMWGGLAGALALAAAAVLFFRPAAHEAPSSAARLEPAVATVAPQPPEPARAPAVVTKAQNDGVLSPEALAMAPEPKSHEVGGNGAKPAAPLAAASPAKARPMSGGVPAPEPAHADAEPKSASAATPVEPPLEPAMKPAQGSTDSLPLSPSGGAVSTALGAVRSQAQACLAGQNGAVTAVVTFSSDGHVTGVSAGGPSGACIQAALSKARLSPFARDQFRATTTIRPP